MTEYKGIYNNIIENEKSYSNEKECPDYLSEWILNLQNYFKRNVSEFYQKT